MRLPSDKEPAIDGTDFVRVAGFASVDEVKSAVARSAAVVEAARLVDSSDPTRMLRAAARSGKARYGRRGLPQDVVAQMYRDYLRRKSLAKAGKLYGRTRQAMYDIFYGRKLPLNERRMHARILFGGIAWTPSKDGYYRPTTGDRSRHLHHAIWEARTGRIVPSGWQVSFCNGDQLDFSAKNLVCLPINEVSRLHYKRHYPGRANWTQADRIAFWRRNTRDYMRRKAAIYLARGLRSDGRKRRRPWLAKRLN